MDLPKIVIDEKGCLRVKLVNGEMLPETELKIENNAGDKNRCYVTVTFLAEHSLKNK